MANVTTQAFHRSTSRIKRLSKLAPETINILSARYAFDWFQYDKWHRQHTGCRGAGPIRWRRLRDCSPQGLQGNYLFAANSVYFVARPVATSVRLSYLEEP